MDELSGLMPVMPADCVVCGNLFELNDMLSCPDGCYDRRVMCSPCDAKHATMHEELADSGSPFCECGHGETSHSDDYSGACTVPIGDGEDCHCANFVRET